MSEEELCPGMGRPHAWTTTGEERGDQEKVRCVNCRTTRWRKKRKKKEGTDD